MSSTRFHLRSDQPFPDEEWESEEKSGGEIVEHRFAFRWASLEEAATILWPHQAMSIEAVRTFTASPLTHSTPTTCGRPAGSAT